MLDSVAPASFVKTLIFVVYSASTVRLTFELLTSVAHPFFNGQRPIQKAIFEQAFKNYLVFCNQATTSIRLVILPKPFIEAPIDVHAASKAMSLA